MGNTSSMHIRIRKAILTKPLLGVPPPTMCKTCATQGRCGRNSSHANGRGGVHFKSRGIGWMFFLLVNDKGLNNRSIKCFLPMVHGRFIVYSVVGYDWASLHNDWQGQIGSWYHWHHTIVLPTPTRFLWKLFIYINSLKRGLQKQLWN